MNMKEKSIFDLCLILLVSAFLVLALGYEPRARLIPLLVAVPTLILLVLQFLVDAVPAATDKLRFMLQSGVFTAENGGSVSQLKQRKEPWPWRILLWLVGFCVAIYYLSYLVVVPLFVFLVTMVEGREKPFAALLLAAGTGIFVYLLFAVLLKASF